VITIILYIRYIRFYGRTTPSGWEGWDSTAGVMRGGAPMKSDQDGRCRGSQGGSSHSSLVLCDQTHRMWLVGWLRSSQAQPSLSLFVRTCSRVRLYSYNIPSRGRLSWQAGFGLCYGVRLRWCRHGIWDAILTWFICHIFWLIHLINKSISPLFFWYFYE
jgi:hypothetical protein